MNLGFVRGLTVAGAVAALLLTCTSAGRVDSASVGTMAMRRLALAHPTKVKAGEPVDVRVNGLHRGDLVTLAVLGSSRPATLSLHAAGESVRFELASDITRSAGVTELIAQTGSSFARSTLTISSGPVAGTIDPLVGPKSMLADGQDGTMAVAFPMDIFGNVAEQGTEVAMALRHPDGEVDNKSAPIRGLLAWTAFTSRTVAGSALVQVTANDASGRTAQPMETLGGRVVEVQENPTRVETFRLIGPALLPRADGASLVRIQTSVVRDVNGNVITDGTAVTFVWDGVHGRSRGVAKTIGGIAELVFEAPTSPDTVRFHGWVRDSVSEPLELMFDAAVWSIGLSAERKSAMVTLRIGPVKSEMSSYLRDGTWADVAFIGSEGGRIDKRVQLVGSTAVVRESVANLRGVVEIRVNVLGADAAVRLERGQHSARNDLVPNESTPPNHLNANDPRATAEGKVKP